jgi:thioredoxin reductase
MSDTIEKIKCLIIGSGPAGILRQYAARANMILYYTKNAGWTTNNKISKWPESRGNYRTRNDGGLQAQRNVLVLMCVMVGLLK